MEEETEPRLFLGCKKEGCNGVLCVSKAARHGMPFQCPRCLNKQKYCADCKQLYINFRRHRQLGHELYEFQRKRQVLMRNNHGLFIPGKYVPDHDQSKSQSQKPYDPMMGGDMMGGQQRHQMAPYHMHHPHQQQQQPQRRESGTVETMREGENSTVKEMDTTGGELDDASDILVKLLHSSNKRERAEQLQQQGSPSRVPGNSNDQHGTPNSYTPPRPAPSGAGPTTNSNAPLPIASHQHALGSNQWPNGPFMNMNMKMASGDPQHPHPPFGAGNVAGWAPPGPMMPGRVMHPHHHPYANPAAPQQRPQLAQISVSQV